MITKNKAFFVFLTMLFVHVYGMERQAGSSSQSSAAETGCARRSCIATETGSASASSSRIEHARPARRDGANSEKMALAFILGSTAAPCADIGPSSVATTERVGGAIVGELLDFKTYPYTCAVCGRGFGRRRVFAEHIRGEEHKDFMYRCVICRKLLPRYGYLDHFCDEHCDKFADGSYKCLHCKCVLKNSHSFRSHVLDYCLALSNVSVHDDQVQRARELVEKIVSNVP